MTLIDVRIPEDQQEGTELELGTWLKQVGDRVEQHEPIAELVTDKAVVEIPAPAAGVLKEILVKPETAVEVDTVLARIEVGAEAAPPPSSPRPASRPPSGEAAEPGPSQPRSDPTRGGQRPAPHPAVVRFAAARGLDLSEVSGTGKGGRVTRQDVLAALGTPDSGAAAGQAPTPTAATPLPPVDGASRTIRHDPMRRSIARNMKDSVLQAPHVTAVFECDLSRVMADREARKQSLAEQGIKLTYSAYFLRACVEAIREVPEVNSRWHDHGLEVFDAIHVGVGTALEDKGLVVPVVRNVQDLDLEGIARELTALTEKARAGRLKNEDMKGSTFTMSNHGVMGSLLASPIIIQQPESAILGIGKLEKRPVARTDPDGQDQVVIRPMMYVTLTIDHRVLDAFHTNRFLTRFVQVLESGVD